MRSGFIVFIILAFTLSQSTFGKLVNPVTDTSVIFTDNTTNNASASKHGYLLKLENTATKYLRDDGTWQTVTGGGGSTNMALNTYTANGVSTTYVLSSNPSVEENTFVYLSGVYQNKSTYTVSGTDLTFAVAPVSGTAVEVMVGTVSGTGGGGGEVNTASNLGTGRGLFAQKSGVDLQFKSVSSTRNAIVTSSDASNVYLDLPTNYFKYTKVLSAVSGTAAVGYADIPNLTSDSLGSGTYQFLFTGEYATSATTTGIGIRLTNGTSTISQIKIKWEAQQAANGTDSYYQYGQLATTSDFASVSVVGANTNYPIVGMGFFTLSASGTVKIQMRSEIALSNAELKANSNYIIQKVE